METRCGAIWQKENSAHCRGCKTAFILIKFAPVLDQILSGQLKAEIITYDRAIVAHRILKEMCSENLKGKLRRRNHISKCETRRINDLQMLDHGLKSQNRVFHTSVQRSGMRSQEAQVM